MKTCLNNFLPIFLFMKYTSKQPAVSNNRWEAQRNQTLIHLWEKIFTSLKKIFRDAGMALIFMKYRCCFCYNAPISKCKVFRSYLNSQQTFVTSQSWIMICYLLFACKVQGLTFSFEIHFYLTEIYSADGWSWKRKAFKCVYLLKAHF